MKTAYAGSMILLLFCLACAPGQPLFKDFAGAWVVDMAASEQVNPTLSDRGHMRAFMAQMLMTINMDNHELTISHLEEQEQKVMPFTILEQADNLLLLRVVDEGSGQEDIRLELKGNELVFKVVGDVANRDAFVFVRPGQ